MGAEVWVVIIGVVLHLLGMTGLVIAAYFRFKGDVQTQFMGLSGHIDRVRDGVDTTNQRLDVLWNKEHERLRLKVESLEERLRKVERRKAV